MAVNFGGTVTLTFQAALDSDGTNKPTPNLIVEQRDRNGVSVMNHSTIQDNRNAQIFSVTFQQVGGNLAGTYNACKFHKFMVKNHINIFSLQFFHLFPTIR